MGPGGNMQIDALPPLMIPAFKVPACEPLEKKPAAAAVEPAHHN